MRRPSFKFYILVGFLVFSFAGLVAYRMATEPSTPMRSGFEQSQGAGVPLHSSLEPSAPRQSGAEEQKSMGKALGSKPQLTPTLSLGIVESIAFSPDGHLVLMGSRDGATRLWEMETGREVRRFVGHLEKVNSVVFSPDGRFVLTGSGDETARLWETETGREVRRFQHPKGDPFSWVHSVAFSSDGRFVLTGSANGTARLWEMETGQEVRRFVGTLAVAFSPDGCFVLTDSGYTARLWERETGREVQHFVGHSGKVSSVAFSPDGRWVLTGSTDETARLWEMETGREVRRFVGHSGEVNSVAFSPDRRIILTSSWDGTARLWETETGQEVRRFQHPKGAFFSPDGSGIVYGSVGSAAFSPDGRFVLTRGGDGTGRLWEVAAGKEVRRFEGHSQVIHSVSPDGRFVLAEGRDGTGRLWEIATGKEVRRFEGHSQSINSVAFSPDGRFVLTGSEDDTGRLWEVATGKEVRRFKGYSNTGIDNVAFSPDGRFVLTVSTVYEEMKMWEVATGKEVRRFEHPGRVRSVAFSPDGRWVLTGSEDGTARLWKARTGREVRRFEGHSWFVNSVAFSADARSLLTGSQDQTVRLWETESGREIQRFEGHSDAVNSVAFSPDGRWVLTGSKDRTARLWEARTGREVERFEGHLNSVDPVAFSSDGRFVLTGEGSTLRLWDIATGKELASFISFEDGHWVVIAPDGHYDSDSPGDLPGVSWIMPEEPLKPYPVEIFMKEYYEPRLLLRLLAGEKFPPLKGLSELNRVQPKVEVKAVEPDANDPSRVAVSVEVQSETRELPRRGKREQLTSGVYDLRLFREGQLVAQAPEAPGEVEVDPTSGQAVLTFPGIRLPASQEQVNFTAYAFNKDGVKGTTHRYEYKLPAPLPERKGRAYLVTIGVNRYENPAWNLKYAAADAEAMQEHLVARLKALKTYDAIVPVLLVAKDEEGASTAVTKARIHAVFDLLAGKAVAPEVRATLPQAQELHKAIPEDLLLIAYSGHGYAQTGGLFHLFPSDIGAGMVREISPDLLQHTVSTDDLSLWLRDVDAGTMVMIVDACNSSATVEGGGFKPGPMGSRGFGQLAYDKGMRILAASQAERVAFEHERLRHGMLSYALVLEGLGAGQADRDPQDQAIRMGEWLRYGVARVPELYSEIQLNTFKPVAQSTKGFDVEVPEGQRAALANLPQPGLFDFAPARADVLLSQRVPQAKHARLR